MIAQQYSIKIIIFFLLIFGTIIFSYCSPKIKRSVLFQGSYVYPWSITYVQENNFPAGKAHYYEVFYKEKKLAIPKEIFGSIHDVSRFTGANGFEIQHEENNSVLLTMEYARKQYDGSHSHEFASFFVAIINEGKEKATFWIYNLDREKIAEFEYLM